MTNKKKILLPIFICVLIISIFSSVMVLSRADDSVKFSYELKTEYTRGLTITLPSAEDDGNILKHVLTYPDGRITSYNKVALDQTGEYTITYYSEKSSETSAVKKCFIVKDSFSGLFTCSDGVEIIAETAIPEYINVDGNTLDGAGDTHVDFFGNKSGAKFKATKKGATINYNGIIDLKELGCNYTVDNVDQWWNRLDSSFIEFLITPNDTGKREFDYLEVTLTDIYDSSNYLTIDITAAEATVSSSMTSCYVAAAPKGLYDTVGKPADGRQGPMSHWGTSVRSTFYGQVGTVDTDSVRLFYNMNENGLYTMPVTPDRYPCVVFNNFANPDLVGLENLWYGFTTGEVYLSIKVGDLLTQEANFMILSVNGQTMNSNFQQGASESEIVIDYGEYQGKELPYGVAGENTSYPIFDAIAVNKVTGMLNPPIVNVYYGGEDGSLCEPIIIVNDRFKTQKVGKYHIVYSSNTNYGNVEKTVTIDVLSGYKDEDRLLLNLSDDIVSNVHIGDVVYLYDAVAEGGVGTLKIDRKAYYQTPTDRESVALDEGGLYPIFTVEKAGQYLLEYIVTDELGATTKETVFINSSYHDKPYIIEPMVPKYAMNGRVIKLPLTTATFVDEQGAHETQVKVMVNGVDYTNKEYAVNGDFTIDYVATVINNPSIINEKSFTIKAVSAEKGQNYFANFFAFNNQDISYSIDKNNAVFTTSLSGAHFGFINYIPVQLFNISLLLPDESNVLDRFNVYMTDSMNKSEKIKLSIVKVENKGKFYPMFAINNKILSTMTGDFSSDVSIPFGFAFENNKNSFIDGAGKNIGTVENYINGQKFNGFSSQMVYVEFEFLLKENAQTCVKISNLGGQSFTNKQQEDEGRPNLVVYEDVPVNRYASIGEKIYVPKCFAFDILGNITEFSCRIYTPENNSIDVNKFDGTFFFTLDTVGIYIMSFSAKDDNNNKLRAVEYYIVVQENNAPTISVSGQKSSYKVGDKFELPVISVADDTTENPKVIKYIENPNFEVSINVDNYTFDSVGKYTMYIYAYDDFSNFTIEKIEIIVN